MNKLILLTTITLLWNASLLAAGTQYNLRVDGLSCPFCAYGIEKKLIRTEGVESVAFDLEKGLVIVKVEEGVALTEGQLKQLVDDAGFTLRSVSEQPL
ncbi:MAG: heavy-metal-associated domain-containing protein [Gammaproteobacteria bacterium]|nr:heavy-metal-associated domain-containing protein [Gammaproteobacteria bacterium]